MILLLSSPSANVWRTFSLLLLMAVSCCQFVKGATQVPSSTSSPSVSPSVSPSISPSVSPTSSLSSSPSAAPISTSTRSGTTRSFTFSIEQRYAPLKSLLPQHTSIYHKFPREELCPKLPQYISVAAMKEDDVEEQDEDNEVHSHSSYVAMGRPIHVLQNDNFQLTILNNLQSTGLSIHFHGFELSNNVQYDGVVGLTQCPISPKTSFGYTFVVDEEPGTYWYHTHSGNLGVDSHNVIKGPLIVHENTEANKVLVDRLNGDKIGTTKLSSSSSSSSSSGANKQHKSISIINYSPLLSYENQRILFFSDGFLKSDTKVEMFSIGGLNPPVQENDDGFVAANMEYEYGTINGKMREVIHVQKGTKYLFRLINGGVHFAFRFSIDSVNEFKVSSSDSTPVVSPSSTKINEIIMHNAERYDIEIDIPSDIPNGSRFWIRIDTLEARSLGFENGIRGILHVVDDISTTADMHDNDILDPEEDIVKGPIPVEERMTINCHSALEKKEGEKNGIGGCLPITVLKAKNHMNGYGDQHHRRRAEVTDESLTATAASYHMVPSVVRTVDFDVSPPPFHAHFVRIDFGNWYQHVGSSTNMMHPDYEPSKHLHPHTAVMDVPANSRVIIIWRSRTLMDHPMHLHGYKMEILDIFVPDRKEHCTLAKCELPDIYNSTEKINELERIPVGSRPIKDTFIMPAGGLVATRIHTREPAPWLAHCHMEVHREDGMAFVLNVGNYFPPKDDAWLPNDFPECDTPFFQSHSHEHPHCDCFVDKDAVMGLTLDPTYKCSRSYLCMHEQSQVAVLHRGAELGGFEIQSKYPFPGYVLSIIILVVTAIITLSFTMVLPRFVQPFTPELVKQFPANSGRFSKMRFSMLSIRKPGTDVQPSFWLQFQALVFSQWSEYRPGTVNILRVVEVAGLGILSGVLFYECGTTETATGFGEKSSLLFFSTTLWSQTRMYPAIGNYYEWTRKDFLTFKHKQYDLLPVFLSRLVVVNICEGFWPFLFVLCSYPLAAMFGNVGSVFRIGFLLSMNNACYIAVGGVFGTLMPTVSLGMIGSTLFGQTTVICAGFFTQLPAAVGWIRHISPIFYAFKGIIKTAYNWYDTYKCPKGQSMVGPNQCFLEQTAAIDDYKQRGINVATYGDPSSNQILLEVTMLFILLGACQLIIFVYQVIMRRSIERKVDDVTSIENFPTQDHHDDEYDEKIMDFGRQSLFLSVDNRVATLRQTMRESIARESIARESSNTSGSPSETKNGILPNVQYRKSAIKNRQISDQSVVSFNNNPTVIEVEEGDGLSATSSANLSYGTALTPVVDNTEEDKHSATSAVLKNQIGSSTRYSIRQASADTDTQEEFLASQRSLKENFYDLA